MGHFSPVPDISDLSITGPTLWAGELARLLEDELPDAANVNTIDQQTVEITYIRRRLPNDNSTVRLADDDLPDEWYVSELAMQQNGAAITITRPEPTPEEEELGQTFGGGGVSDHVVKGPPPHGPPDKTTPGNGATFGMPMTSGTDRMPSDVDVEVNDPDNVATNEDIREALNVVKQSLGGLKMPNAMMEKHDDD